MRTSFGTRPEWRTGACDLVRGKVKQQLFNLTTEVVFKQMPRPWHTVGEVLRTTVNQYTLYCFHVVHLQCTQRLVTINYVHLWFTQCLVTTHHNGYPGIPVSLPVYSTPFCCIMQTVCWTQVLNLQDWTKKNHQLLSCYNIIANKMPNKTDRLWAQMTNSST